MAKQPPKKPSWINNLIRGAATAVGNAGKAAGRAVTTAVGNPVKQAPKAATNWAKTAAAKTPAERNAAVWKTATNVSGWVGKTAARNAQASVVGNAAKGKTFTDYNDARNNPANWRQNNVAAQAGQQYQREQPMAANPLYGVNYGNNWQRPAYVPPAAFRYENPEIQMTQDEYIRRRNAQTRMFFPGQTQAYLAGAAATPNQPHWNGTQWASQNPAPGSNFWQMPQETTVRQNAAPPGMVYMPFGATYYPKPTLAAQPDQSGAGGGDYGYGGGGYGGGGYGGGGGGGGYDYKAALQEYWANMVSWSINQADQGG